MGPFGKGGESRKTTQKMRGTTKKAEARSGIWQGSGTRGEKMARREKQGKNKKKEAKNTYEGNLAFEKQGNSGKGSKKNILKKKGRLAVLPKEKICEKKGSEKRTKARKYD